MRASRKPLIGQSCVLRCLFQRSGDISVCKQKPVGLGRWVRSKESQVANFTLWWQASLLPSVAPSVLSGTSWLTSCKFVLPNTCRTHCTSTVSHCVLWEKHQRTGWMQNWQHCSDVYWTVCVFVLSLKWPTSSLPLRFPPSSPFLEHACW